MVNANHMASLIYLPCGKKRAVAEVKRGLIAEKRGERTVCEEHREEQQAESTGEHNKQRAQYVESTGEQQAESNQRGATSREHRGSNQGRSMRCKTGFDFDRWHAHGRLLALPLSLTVGCIC